MKIKISYSPYPDLHNNYIEVNFYGDTNKVETAEKTVMKAVKNGIQDYNNAGDDKIRIIPD